MKHQQILTMGRLTAVLLMVLSTALLATGTPVWWDNPKELPYHVKSVFTGTASNTGDQAQFVIAKLDVPNTYRENLSKYVWAQVEWSLVQGTGNFQTGSFDHLIKWLNSEEQCPSSPELDYPEPDGAGFMKNEGEFTPEFGFANGYEVSYTKIMPQPACERLEIKFNVGPNSRIDYRIEVQTICINWDFGDAPDPTFPTKLASNGARHIVTPLYLGSKIDHEADGLPTAAADGDDTNGEDDEDGVVFANPAHITQGSLAAINVTASQPGKLFAWADWNGNGSWADAGEQIFTARALAAGLNPLAISVPADAAIGLRMLRFRFSTDLTLSYTGAAGDGEVEDYIITVLPAEYDYGDAPDPTFPTLIASNGARHLIGDLRLGALIDAETEALQNGDATGDDNDGDQDEDGVVFDDATLIKGGIGAVVVTASGAGKLNAWIDFNNDGSWDDAGEQIFSDRVLVAGPNALTFAIPPYAAVAHVFTRFRFSTQGGLTPTGTAGDGEVEDYKIEVLLAVELSSFSARQSQGAVTLEWTTQSETENLGFHVYRAEGEGEFLRITTQLINGAGTSATAHSYNFADQAVEAGKRYRYKLADMDRSGRLTFGSAIEITMAVPVEFSLGQNYPNPFNPTTNIPFQVKTSGMVTLDIYNLKGQLVRSLVNQTLQAGSHMVVWDGRSDKGSSVPSGSYLYKVKVGSFEQVKMMELVK